MQQRQLGRTNLEVSSLGFGCGNVGGLFVRGSRSDQERAVARAIDLGVKFFDTAPHYGDSEVHLGRALKAVGVRPLVGTKLAVVGEQRSNMADVIAKSIDASLSRLGVEQIDLMQLHNFVELENAPSMADYDLTVEQVLNDVIPAMEVAQRTGKIRFIGMTGVGATKALKTVVESGKFDTIQVVYNLINPSAGRAVPGNFPDQDYKQLMASAKQQNMGVIGIRALAGGALSASSVRAPNAAEQVYVLGSGNDYGEEVERARSFAPLWADGALSGPVEAAFRFALFHPSMDTAVIGFSNMEQLEQAAAAAEAGPLPDDLMALCVRLQDAMSAPESKRAAM